MNIFELKTSLLIGFIISIVFSFVMGYSLGKMNSQPENVVIETVNPTIDTAPLQTITNQIGTTSNEMDSRVKQLDTILVQLKTISNKTLTTLKSLEKQTVQLVTVNQTPNPSPSPQVSEQTSDSSNSPPIDSPPTAMVEELDEETLRKLKVSLALVDSEHVEQKAEQMFLGEAVDREKAIQAIARVSSPEVKTEIVNFIHDPDEDMGVRLTAINSLDWSGEAETLTNIFQTDNSHEIRLATVHAARETEFDDFEKEQLNQVFFDNFQTETDENVKLAILDYFSDNQPETIEQLLTLVPPDNFSPEVRKHVELFQNQLPIEDEEIENEEE